MILVDTSVWLDFLIGRDTPYRAELHRLIETGADIAVSGVVLQEILQGMASDLDWRRAEKYLLEFQYLSLKEPETFLLASQIYRECRRKGKTTRKPVDCLIAAHAIQNNAHLFHNDRDFRHISEVFPLRIYRMQGQEEL